MSELRTAKERLREGLEQHFQGAPRAKGFARVEVPAPAVDLPRLLAANPLPPRFFWSGRDGALEVAGFGAADQVASGAPGETRAALALIRERIPARFPHLRYFGGLSFAGDATPGQEWQPFGACRFVLPRFEIAREKATWRLACTFLDDPAADRRGTLRQLLEELSHLRTGVPAAAALPPVTGRLDHPDREGWVQAVEGVLRWIGRGRFQKVVLARQSVFKFAEPPEPFELLRRLREVNPEGFHFAFQPREGVTFLGASPERLYRRRQNRIVTEAVAGTRRRGESAREDQAIGDVLLDSEKDRREHRFVSDTIAERLDDLCLSHRADAEVSLLKLTRLQHLYRRFEGTLRPEVEDADIIAALHPTPAVAGNPTAAALAEIARREPFPRGWYAGPVGWVGARGAEFAVAIRSGLASGTRLALYTGAGIVEGSRPLVEWEELENKLASFVRVIGVP